MTFAAAILMPKLGLTMTEGLLASWRVGPGDRVHNGDVLFVVETEKIATEIEAERDGRIATIEVSEGAIVPVGTVVATWAGRDGISPGEAARPPARQSEIAHSALPEALPLRGEPVPPVRPVRPVRDERIRATPLARRLAREAGIDLAEVSGSGPRGRIKVCDIEREVAGRGAAPQQGAHGSVDQASARKAGERRAASATEKTIARRMAQSKQAIPHFYVLGEADVTRLMKLRDDLNEMEGFTRVSISHLVMAAVGRSIVRMPEINVIWDADTIVQLADSDVGMAVDTERGLVAPLLRNAGGLTLEALAREADALIKRAREGQLRAEDLSGGAISVSNVGMYGASHLVPIINPGQSAILGVAGIKPVFRPDENEAPVLRREIGLVLSCDHRVLSGVVAARFLDCVAGILQNPLGLLRA